MPNLQIFSGSQRYLISSIAIVRSIEIKIEVGSVTEAPIEIKKNE